MATIRMVQAVKSDTPYVVADAGKLVDLADDVAAFAVLQGWGVYEGHQIPVRVVPEPVIPPAGVSPAEPDDFTPHSPGPGDAGTKPEPPTEPAEPIKRPYGNKPKQEWAEYAAAVDPEMTLDRALGMSKNDLLARYGERL